MTVYLDHAASTPLRDEARAAWVEASAVVGNPASIHGDGQSARRVLETSRERLAAVLGCDPIEVVFTSSGTEATNLALKGLWWAAAERSAPIVLPDGEHHATLDAVDWLARREGAAVRAVPLRPDGRIDTHAFAAALPDAALATALIANNEVGTLNPAGQLSEAAARAGVPLHLDAVAALGQVPVSFRELRADASPGVGLVAMSVSAHKVGGPIGVGALVVARTATVDALVHGGGQQRRLRSGTQDVAGAAAFAAAAEVAQADLARERERLSALRDRLANAIVASVPDAVILGHPSERLPGNVHALFPGARGETLLFLLDMAGISASTGSACQAGVPEPSHVVEAMGFSAAEASEVLRFTLGHTTTHADVDAVIGALPAAVARARAASGPRSVSGS